MDKSAILRALREQNGWSQEYLANELEISQPSYCSLELGKRKLSLARAEKLAKLFNVPISIFTEDDQRVVNYNTGSHSRTIISSRINEETISLGERALYKELINEKDNQIKYLKSEIHDLKKNISFLQNQLEIYSTKQVK